MFAKRSDCDLATVQHDLIAKWSDIWLMTIVHSIIAWIPKSPNNSFQSLFFSHLSVASLGPTTTCTPWPLSIARQRVLDSWKLSPPPLPLSLSLSSTTRATASTHRLEKDGRKGLEETEEWLVFPVPSARWVLISWTAAWNGISFYFEGCATENGLQLAAL